MKGIEVPERTEDFTADPVELFFDLAFVFAFSQLVSRLLSDHSWSGIGEVGLLFGLLWLPWQQLTWSANAVSGNGRRVRIIFLLATAACVPMAAATSSALDTGGPVFAVCLAIIMALGFALQRSTFERGTAYERATLRWMVPNLLAISVLLVGALVGGGWRTALWCISLAIVFGAMSLAGSGEWLIRSGHFAERHALIIIVALGEVIVAIGIPVVDALEEGEGLAAETVISLVAAGAFAALLWWAYFDRVGPALEHRISEVTDDRDRGRYVRDIYTWAHAPLVGGVILAAAGLEEITLHPGDAVPMSYRAMLVGGLGLTALGVTASIGRAFRIVAFERIVGTALLAAFVLVAGSLDGVVVLVTVVLLLAVMLAVEHVRIER